MRIIETFKFWLRLRKANKRLLKRLKTADTTPYTPPTREEVLAFIEKAECMGITFNCHVQPLPKTPKQSAYVDVN